MKKLLTACLVILLACVLSCALADEAKEISEGITYESNAKSDEFANMRDDDFSTYFPLKDKKGYLEVHSEEPVYGIYLMQFEKNVVPLSYDLQVKGSGGEWETVAQGGEYLVHWHPLEEGVTEFRIAGTSAERIRISELRLYGEGEKPAELQDWQTIDKCDLMLLSGHPDDETLWFAGLLPTYAGERKLRVQVAVMVPTGGMRKLELLHAIWHSGVTAYPEFIGFVDNNGKTVEGQYAKWRGKNRVLGLVTEVIRKHQPEVLVTHDENGEYGHGAHRTACAAAKECFKIAAKEKQFPKSAKTYGAWQIKKLYIHLYGTPREQVEFDWTVPLDSLGGETPNERAADAYAMHKTQVGQGRKSNGVFTPFSGEEFGVKRYPNNIFGLYATRVGPDIGHDDMLENIEGIEE